ncbi:hypothetical protein GT347_25245 [Xylophilus rhododendri]|uniref:Uncharacterized protein n=1 Tax=Xylophilus rhododendri TaxID=2697032 RepID=A0A857JAH6_9BURK|nr:hypothetical protein [Xylophilus rhododendri]QHJ01005.1 hypothetical protein GT347_25245 [Xylophilus rhododendri]
MHVVPLEERSVELHNGARAALATLHRFDSGWQIDVVAEPDVPDLTDDDTLYPTLQAARDAALRLWLT